MSHTLKTRYIGEICPISPNILNIGYEEPRFLKYKPITTHMEYG